MSTAGFSWKSLASSLTGELLRPGGPGYEAASRPEMSRFATIRPQAIARCASACDVTTAIAFARAHDLRTATRSGGHCFAGRSSTEGLLIDVGAMQAIEVTGDTVTVGPGTRLGALYRRLAADGRTIPGGCGPTVAIAGLTLGGGLGLLGRAHGLTCDSLLGATVALADGRTVGCDAHRDPDLFWGLRGAGAGRFGVVTSLSFRTVTAPVCTAFELGWDYAHARTLLKAWQIWGPEGPDELAASLLLNGGFDPSLPPRVTVLGAMLGRRADADELLDALQRRVGALPSSDWRQEMSWLQTKEAMVARAPGEDEGDMYQRSEFFRRPLPVDMIEELLHWFVADRRPGVARELDFTPWRGEYNRVARDATAFAHRAERFLLKHATVVHDDAPAAHREHAQRWLSGSSSVVARWGTGRVYPNFPDPELAYPGRAHYAENLERVQRVTAAYDPEGVFERADDTTAVS